MSKDVNVNGKIYPGVSQIQLNTTDGITALFKDIDEISASGGVESGTFVGDGTFRVTLPVTSKKTAFLIWLENLWEEKKSGALVNHDVCIKFGSVNGDYFGMYQYYGTNFNGNMNMLVDKVVFNDNSIEIKQPAEFQKEKFVSGKTYRWYAW